MLTCVKLLKILPLWWSKELDNNSLKNSICEQKAYRFWYNIFSHDCYLNELYKINKPINYWTQKKTNFHRNGMWGWLLSSILTDTGHKEVPSLAPPGLWSQQRKDFYTHSWTALQAIIKHTQKRGFTQPHSAPQPWGQTPETGRPDTVTSPHLWLGGLRFSRALRIVYT